MLLEARRERGRAKTGGKSKPDIELVAGYERRAVRERATRMLGTGRARALRRGA